MRTGFPVFFRLVGRTIFCSRGTFGRLTVRRAVKMSVVIPGVFLGQVVHRAAFVLDDLLFPGYKQIDVKEPVFILGVPRSGTTHLHRLMARDTTNFTTMTTWEMVIAPSIVERKLILGLAALDEKLLGGAGHEALVKLDEWAFRGVQKIHKVTLFEPEEDDIVLFPIFASMFLFFLFPFPEELWHLARFDTETPIDDRHRIMSFYKACVQRHLYVHGTEKRFLSKNPAMSPKIDSIDAYFPDSKVICNVRNPYQALPSLMSFLSFNFDRFDNDRQGNRFRDLILDMAGHWYRYPAERLPKWPKSRATFLTYDRLSADPKQCIMEIYDSFGISMTPEFEAFLTREQEKARTYKSKHSYSLADIDLTPEQVLEDFKDVFERFGFEQDHAVTHGSKSR